MNEYVFKLFSQADFNEYTKLVNLSAFDPVPLDTQDRRKWWCFDNPNDGAFAVALYGHRVASTCYLSGKNLILNGTSYKAYEIGETATAPEHQRKGLFSKLVTMCTSYAFDKGAVAVYGTPNAQSTPGYEKLDFQIIDDGRSHLFMSPNISSFVTLNATQPMIGFPREQSTPGDSYQISPAKFFLHSQTRRRLNIFSDEYFKWRFNGISTNRYRFYLRGEFSMAAREARLGKYKVLMVSDFGYADSKPETFAAIKEIRKIVRREFRARHYAGIYFNSAFDDSVSRLRYGIKGLIHHRSLPICVATNHSSKFIADLRNVGLPQLTDCDIG